ncbi:glycosyltransferase [Enterobacter chuandaensis]|uniref:glycosyltransferase n=1 Tax=Enterobacter chuandaensis TaxID=2497875 RepID=UPI0020756309|nr:glycosyltransferase [Enterobacter chuandaensis]MCM7589009.1 glycosyltransferase [Enterobacter chuandaensis]
MRKILLTIDRFEHYGQHESIFFDLIEYFHRHNWQVDVFAKTTGRYWLNNLNVINENKTIRLLEQPDGKLQNFYDLMWIFNGYIPAELNMTFMQGDWVSRIFFHHFYSYADYDLPYGADVENALSSISFACSTASYVRLVEKGIKQPRIKIFPLTINNQFASAEGIFTGKLEKALLISTGYTKNIAELIESFQTRNIELDYYNLESAPGPVTPELLSQYQLVIGDEARVVLAMGMGLPVVISDGISSHGYLTEANLLERSDYHFALTGAPKIVNRSRWIKEILDGHSQAAHWAWEYRAEVNAQLSLDSCVGRILDRLPAPKALKISQEQYRNLEFHRKVMDTFGEETTRSVSSWMNERKPTQLRSAIISMLLQSFPACASISVIIIDRVGDHDKLRASLRSVNNQTLSADLLIVVGKQPLQGITADPTIRCVDDLNLAVDGIASANLLIIESGDILEEHALLTYAEFTMRDPQKELWYFDELVIRDDKEDGLILKPECDIDMLRAHPFIGSSVFISTDALRRHNGFNPDCQYLSHIDLCWKLIEEKGPFAVGHIPEALIARAISMSDWCKNTIIMDEMKIITAAHLSRCGIHATITSSEDLGIQFVTYQLPAIAKVSVIIPTRDRLVLLQRCIDSLMEKTAYHQYEIIIVDNGSTDEDAKRYIDQLESMQLAQIKVLRWDAEFNFAAINNYASRYATGEYLLFMNNDVEIDDPNWMGALLELAQRPEVGIVGSKLEYPDGTLEHGGYITGINDGVIVCGKGSSPDDSGFLSRLKIPRGAHAVSAACMMVRKGVFDELGGFDEENFPIYYSDVDLALKAKAQGYITLWTPFSRVKHLGGASRLFPEKFAVATHADEACHDALLEKWGAELARDPYYNPNMNRLGSTFSLNTRMSRLPHALPGKPLPIIMGTHINWTGCGNYRVIKPLRALQRELKADGGLILGLPTVMEVAQFQPDRLILEVPIADDIPQTVQRYRQVCNTKIIMEFDDYYLDVPEKNIFRENVPKDIQNRLTSALALADWVVVSTEPLAEAYSRFHSDIRVAKNRLDMELWGNLKSAKRRGKKPRVGWAGGASHTGDLEILLPIIYELKDEVEWVFMGMKPEGIACEFHLPVPFEHYPQKLSELDLDLALVPLEQNRFNECKSNLRLLELGSCGFPIICTDIEPYRCGLPVHRVKNTPNAWISAVREHIHDWNALDKAGEELRNAVHRDWMLREGGLDDWQRAWIG